MKFIKKLFGQSDPQPDKPQSAAPPPAPEPEPIRVQEILPDELNTRLENGTAPLVIDMRQGWEYAAGHIPRAMHMFIQEIPGRIDELPKDRDVVFQCWHGNTSLDASAFLIQNGWDAKRVWSLNGGMAGWVTAMGQDSLSKA